MYVPWSKNICTAYHEMLDINNCNNYTDQFIEAMCGKKIKICMDLVKETNC